MSENQRNAQLQMNQLIKKGKKCFIQASGHVGEIKIVNFSDGTKTVNFVSADGEIDFTLVTNEPFQLSTDAPIAHFVPPEIRELFPYWAINFKAYLRCKRPSKACLDCQFLEQCQGINNSLNVPKPITEG